MSTPSSSGRLAVPLHLASPAALAGGVTAAGLLAVAALVSTDLGMLLSVPVAASASYGAANCLRTTAKVQSGVDPSCGCAEYDYVDLPRTERRLRLAAGCAGAGVAAGLVFAALLAGPL